MSVSACARILQCKACPWKKSTRPAKDIPGGYDPKKHERLARCDGSFGAPIMACHETTGGHEQACVGFLAWAVGDGNSIPLRMAAMRGEFDPRKLVLDGEQYESLTAMVKTAGRRRA